MGKIANENLLIQFVFLKNEHYMQEYSTIYQICLHFLFFLIILINYCSFPLQTHKNSKQTVSFSLLTCFEILICFKIEPGWYRKNPFPHDRGCTIFLLFYSKSLIYELKHTLIALIFCKVSQRYYWVDRDYVPISKTIFSFLSKEQ